MKLFAAKISEREVLQNLGRERVTVHCYPRMLTDDRRYSEVSVMNFQLQNFQLYNNREQFILFPSNLNVFLSSASGNIKILGKQKMDGFPWHGTSH